MSVNTNEREELLTKEELHEKFVLSNYLVFVAMLVISAGIGVFYWWRGQKSTEEFLLASRSMGTLPMTMSLIASFMSAITLLGVPAEIYTGGTQYMVGIISNVPVMAATIHFYLPVYDELRVSTSYEYLEIRFNKGLRMLISLLFCISALIMSSLDIAATLSVSAACVLSQMMATISTIPVL